MAISLNSDPYRKHTKKTISFKRLNLKKSKFSNSFLQRDVYKEYEIYKLKVGQSFDKMMTFCEK